jgi:aromatic ring hydroxylase
MWKTLNTASIYVIDSVPIAVCDNIRIRRSKIYRHEKYRGYKASKKRYFYGLKFILEFAYGLATRMAEAIGDTNPPTHEMLGELLGYVEVTRSAVLLSAEHGRHIGDGIWFPDGRPLQPLRALLATWFPRVNEIIMLIGSHNLLATPSRRNLDDPELRPLLDEFLHGANNLDADNRAALFRLAWDFVGSGLGARNVLYERFYLTSASRNRINHHLRHTDRHRAYELVDGILSSARHLGH